MQVNTTLWSPATIADAIWTGLKARAAADELEQVVYGFDHLDELGLHPLLHGPLRSAGYGVWPEQRYPSDREGRNRSHGQRCDIVLTPDGRPLRDAQVKATLFDDPSAVDPQEAYWLEVKTVAQFQTDGPFHRYSAELLSPVTQDVRKLWCDGLVYHSGLLLLLFTVSQELALHDLGAWHRRCLERGYPVAAPAIRGLALNDRIGNAWCAAAVFPVRGA